jgi:putative component of toxin-antitoxin plasmid stabilization module
MPGLVTASILCKEAKSSFSLAGGDKSTQEKDIRDAKALVRDL